MDFRLVIIILSEYVGRYSTIRLYGMIVSTCHIQRLTDIRPDVHARPTVGTTDIGSFVDTIVRVGARRDGKPLLSSETVVHMFTRANKTSDSGVGGATVGIYRLTPIRRLTLGPVRPMPDSDNDSDNDCR